jgi:molybdopterin converting factor small subunit
MARITQEFPQFDFFIEILGSGRRLSAYTGSFVLALNQEYIDLNDDALALRTGDEVAVIPPLSGG